MPKVFAIHYFELKPGASAEALDRLLAANPFPTLPGWKSYFARGDRGERASKYVLIHEFDSVEIRDRYFPTEGGAPNPEVERLFNDPTVQAVGQEWDKLATSLMKTVYTDYVVVG
jgi:hypothetical protein